MNLLPEAPSPSNSEEPLYNIGVVSRMTGISMATLRAWERRYDFPEAQRTAGGHRLYSEKDILRLRWVKTCTGEGMQTAQAILALRRQEESGLATLDSAAAEQLAPQRWSTAPFTEPSAETHTALEQYREQLFHALVQCDLVRADVCMGEALAISTPELMITQVLGPALAQMGDAWELGKISVAAEHLGTNYLRQRLHIWMVNSPPALARPPVLLACAPGEWHEGGLLILGTLLHRRRWPVAYLGQAVPLADLATFVHEIQPSLVVLVAMTEGPAIALADWPQNLPEVERSGKPAICYGGRIFTRQPEFQARTPGTYLGDTIQAGLETIENILK